MKQKHLKSGKFVLRVPAELHLELSEKADDQNVSLNEFCLSLITAALRGVSKDDLKEKLLPLIFSVYPQKDLLGVVLFGSVARGEQTASSDVDLLLVFDQSIPIRRSLYRPWENLNLRNELEKISIHCVHLPESENETSGLWKEISLEGKIWYDPLKKVENFMSLLKNAILAGKFNRKFTHGHPYWVEAETIKK